MALARPEQARPDPTGPGTNDTSHTLYKTSPSFSGLSYFTQENSCVYLMLATVRIFTTALEIRGAIFGAATSASGELSSDKHALYRALFYYTKLMHTIIKS